MGAFAFGLFVAAGVVLFRSSVDQGVKWMFPHQAVPAQRFLWVVAIVVFFAILENLSGKPREAQAFLTVALIAATLCLCVGWFVREWKREFLLLMSMTDDEMPGRNDKVIWAVVLVAFAPIGLWLFRSFRRAHWPELESDADHGVAKGAAIAPEL